MDNDALIINVLTTLFLTAWGAYERISAIRKEEKNPRGALSHYN